MKMECNPERNTGIGEAMNDFLEKILPYLNECHQGSNYESGLVADKKMSGWNIAKKREGN